MEDLEGLAVSNKKDYVIVAPKYSKSNGVRTLYRLAMELENKGYNVYVFAPQTKDVNCKFISQITDEMRKNSVVVYPEIVFGNPLRFNNVVRYILYYPGILGGSKKYCSNELLVTYSKKYYPEALEMYFPCLDNKLFYKDSTAKDVDCYFVNKKGKWKEIKEFENMVEINASYPETREKLAQLLRRTKTLYSYDDCTLLLDEAYACGCNVKVITETGFVDYVSNYEEIYKNYEALFDNFIKQSQAMNFSNYQEKQNFPNISLKKKLSYYKNRLLYKMFLLLKDEDNALKRWWKAETKLRCKNAE